MEEVLIEGRPSPPRADIQACNGQQNEPPQHDETQNWQKRTEPSDS